MKELIVANWKMNMGGKEGLSFLQEFSGYCQDIPASSEVVICPPATALFIISEGIKGLKIGLGAQNMYYEEKGAYTGEISPSFLKEAACQYVIIGHSERRQYFLEDGPLLNKKIKAALKWGLTPILCVGENLAQREEGLVWETISKQIEEALAGIDSSNLANLVVAYEPIWAIGTGQWAKPEDAQKVAAQIRERLFALTNLRILYGGSVNPENVNEYLLCSDINGALVGGASLKAKDFFLLAKGNGRKTI